MLPRPGLIRSVTRRRRPPSSRRALGSALSAGSLFREIRVGFGLEVGEDERKDNARKAAEEADRLATNRRRSLSPLMASRKPYERLNPELREAEIRFGSLSAAGDAFRKSIDQSTSFDDLIGAGLSLNESFDEFRKTFRRIPEDLDPIGLAFQKLRPRTREAIQNMLSLGEASKDYLATLLEQGESSDTVRAQADKLRAELVQQFKQVGLNDEQIAKMLETLGLTPEAVETAIELSGLEESKFKLNAYIDLLDGKIPRRSRRR